MRRTTRTTAREETSYSSDRMAKRQRNREVVRASPKAQSSRPRKNTAGRSCAEESAEEHKTGAEISPEANLTRGVVMPPEEDKECFGTDNSSEQHQPHRGPELVFANPDFAVPPVQPQNRCDSTGSGKESEWRHGTGGAKRLLTSGFAHRLPQSLGRPIGA
jgi:hypothetical protein